MRYSLYGNLVEKESLRRRQRAYFYIEYDLYKAYAAKIFRYILTIRSMGGGGSNVSFLKL